jgi:hypothetical protein
MARKRRKSFITAFTDFHNMKLLPKNKPKKYRAGPLPRRRLLVYFEDYAKQVLQCQSAEEYKNFLEACDTPEHFTERLRGTLGGYEHENGVSWFDSDDYHEFACEYAALHEMIIRMVSEGKISKGHYNFFSQWSRKFSSTTQPVSMKDIDENGDYLIGGDLWEQSARPDKHELWHGLFMSDVGWSMQHMIQLVIRGKFEFSLCHYCQKGICGPWEPITRFCSVSCRTQHHNMGSKTA